jgi:hypothetical protein
MHTYIPDIDIKNPANAAEIDKLVKEYDAINYTDLVQGRADQLYRQEKTRTIIRKLEDMGETTVAARLRR